MHDRRSGAAPRRRSAHDSSSPHQRGPDVFEAHRWRPSRAGRSLHEDSWSVTGRSLGAARIFGAQRILALVPTAVRDEGVGTASAWHAGATIAHTGPGWR